MLALLSGSLFLALALSLALLLSFTFALTLSLSFLLTLTLLRLALPLGFLLSALLGLASRLFFLTPAQVDNSLLLGLPSLFLRARIKIHNLGLKIGRASCRERE